MRSPQLRNSPLLWSIKCFWKRLDVNSYSFLWGNHSKNILPLPFEFSPILSVSQLTRTSSKGLSVFRYANSFWWRAGSQEKHSTPNRKQVSSKDHDTLLASECSAQCKKEKKKKEWWGGITSHGQKESSEEGAQCSRLLETLERVLCGAPGLDSLRMKDPATGSKQGSAKCWRLWGWIEG